MYILDKIKIQSIADISKQLVKYNDLGARVKSNYKISTHF